MTGHWSTDQLKVTNCTYNTKTCLGMGGWDWVSLGGVKYRAPYGANNE